MNDFTKEELISLKLHVDSSLAQDDNTEELMIKIQSLIDNYCEHGNMWAHQSKCPDCGASDEIPGLI